MTAYSLTFLETMPRYKLVISYDGTNFSGWQIQPHARTVEQVLEEAFTTVLQIPVDIIGQGRTDAGVHARGQVAHVDLQEIIDPQKIIHAVNGMVGDEVYIQQINEVKADFHSRFDAIGREYLYTIITQPDPLKRNHSWNVRYNLDINKLRKCAKDIEGDHDFSGFSKYNEDNFTTICTILTASIETDGNAIYFRIQANRFLRNMVRRLIGTMVDVASGRLSQTDFMHLLQDPDADIRTFTAPAKGLILDKVLYKKEQLRLTVVE